ncbi:MAG TPA: anthranilate phosphoribosyltransferase [Terriglobales bacterium]|nr:anthranilate phosphoribosyltransferase [Terriglobales bacterium]
MHPVSLALDRLAARQDLSHAEARALVDALFAGEATEIQTAGILVGLAVKGETVDEIVGFAEGMRAAVTPIGLPASGHRYVDTCGTGGSARDVFNISTAAALAAAGAGVKVAKHGNRTSTSVCGSADVIEALGVNLSFPASELGACLESVGIAFLFAPLLHGAMRHVMPVRRGLKLRTIFNLLGPLTNPAGADAQVVGVSSAALIPKIAQALARLGTRHSFVVRCQDGLGELSTTACNDVAEVKNGNVLTYTLDAAALGLRPARLEALRCTTMEQAVADLRSVLEGKPSPHRDIVCLNAAAALVAGERAGDLREGIELARQALDSGAARARLDALVAYTRGVKTSAQGS